MKRVGIGLLALAFLGSVGYAEHSPLLPRPQQVRYGSGDLALRTMQISFVNPPNEEDRFAAEQLRSWLSARTGHEVTIAAYGNSSNDVLRIVLDRDGGQDQPLAL